MEILYPTSLRYSTQIPGMTAFLEWFAKGICSKSFRFHRPFTLLPQHTHTHTHTHTYTQIQPERSTIYMTKTNCAIPNDKDKYNLSLQVYGQRQDNQLVSPSETNNDNQTVTAVDHTDNRTVSPLQRTNATTVSFQNDRDSDNRTLLLRTLEKLTVPPPNDTDDQTAPLQATNSTISNAKDSQAVPSPNNTDNPRPKRPRQPNSIPRSNRHRQPNCALSNDNDNTSTSPHPSHSLPSTPPPCPEPPPKRQLT